MTKYFCFKKIYNLGYCQFSISPQGGSVVTRNPCPLPGKKKVLKDTATNQKKNTFHSIVVAERISAELKPTLMMGVINSSMKLCRSSDGQLWWIKLINKPLMWEPSWSCSNHENSIVSNNLKTFYIYSNVINVN